MISFTTQSINDLFSSSLNYSIPIGFIARNERVLGKEENEKIRFYTEEITLDSSVFIFKSKNRITFVHIDSNYDDRINLEKIEEELQYVLSDKDNGDEMVMVFRCFNIPVRKDAVEKQRETNSTVELIWIDIQNKLKEKLKGIIEFKEINVVESISISLSDKAPILQRIPEEYLKVSKINQSLLNSISIINDFVDPAIQLKGPPSNIIIFENGLWNDQLISQMTTPNTLANEFLLQDPNQFEKYLEPFLKIHNSIDSTQLNNFIDQLFQAINIYRGSLNLGSIKKAKVGPNDICPCKSKQKFKKCHGSIKNGIIRKTYLEY
ncbi:hypothetical protein DICPUDRAFT_40464 [Dictyostelium purpureum]|uniref:Uncharacterized protein n=1 Tax=Dictyostelium purpureum TaxID=5786 RepID=F0ZY81_DICPU|nr:uncharacterized protein DICPUDRAFT_40464 [Dictyostelium purpureum]EGC31103.1 hypothetical protein DICPUDRAFT_40464 [Dictyostelium purpureum]|eukprot:XP_003292380.1 hypothetical protein DICPUDRAFT_40464 [Dictyostelium purpureum]